MGKIKIGFGTPVDTLMDDYRAFEKDYDVVYGELYSRKDYKYSDEELLEKFAGVRGLMIASREKLRAGYFNRVKNLIVVVKQGSGYNNIDVAAATRNGILVCNSPAQANSISTAEGAVTHILAASKKYLMLDKRARSGQWKDIFYLPSQIYGKTVGILGFGRIGQNVAQRLQGWGVTILVYDPYIPNEVVKEKGCVPVALERLLRESDIITPHLVLNDSTRHIIDAKAFSMMKPTAILVNVARGGIIDQEALVNALKNHRIAGAGIDVFETEPLTADEPITKLDNVTLTPHSVGLTVENMQEMVQLASRELIQAVNGEVPEFVVNREVIPAWQERINGLKG